MAFEPSAGPATSTLYDNRITLKWENGVSTSGSPVTENKTYQNVNLKATDLEIYNFGQAIQYLSAKALSGIAKGESYEVTVSE